MKAYVIRVYNLKSRKAKISQEGYKTLDAAVAFIKSRSDYNGDCCVKNYRKLLTQENLYEIFEVDIV